jgi:hypothetical protein
MKKTVRLGKTRIGNRLVSVFCKIQIEDGKLSITGVEGPMSNGNAAGSCGQIDMHRPEIVELAPGWTRDKLAVFWDTWKAWHLNDMRAGCEHQRAKWNPSEDITLYYYRLRPEVDQARRNTETAAKACIAKGETFTPTAEQTRIALLPDKITLAEAELPANLTKDYTANGPIYTGDTYNRASEKKTAGWVKPSEHPKGLLCKPCEVCSYEYGSAWLRQELPADVVSFLGSLPETDITPAWV